MFSIFFVFLLSGNFKFAKLYIDITATNNNKFDSSISNIKSDNKDLIQESFIIESSNFKDNVEWKIEIPRIELIANISEGTSEKILDYYVGHFEETKIWDGNIGLAAHNRGYQVNYFEKIKELETGDEIFYKYKDKTRKYIVKERQIIKETDWSYLEETTDNRLTLITCVEDMPEYRRCIQAVEEKEE